MIKELWRKYGLLLIGGVLGAIAGYVYWYYWGCNEGCTIRSVWWRMSLWGTLMGALVFSLFGDLARKKGESKS